MAKGKAIRQLERDLRIYKQLIAVLVLRQGGSATIAAEEFDANEGKRVSIVTDPTGAQITVSPIVMVERIVPGIH